MRAIRIGNQSPDLQTKGMSQTTGAAQQHPSDEWHRRAHGRRPAAARQDAGPWPAAARRESSRRRTWQRADSFAGSECPIGGRKQRGRSGGDRGAANRVAEVFRNQELFSSGKARDFRETSTEHRSPNHARIQNAQGARRIDE